MNFIFSNDFFTIFCENNTSQNVYTSTTFFKKSRFFHKVVSSLCTEKLLLITKNGGIFSYK